MNISPTPSRLLLPVVLLGTVTLVLLACLAHLGYGQETWTLLNSDLAYTGCGNWCN